MKKTKKHKWIKKDDHEKCLNCDAKREMTSHGWQYWIVTLAPTPKWMSHFVQESVLEYPVLFGSSIPKCARGMDLLDF